MKNAVLWRCDVCDGPAWWCFDDVGPLYLCKNVNCMSRQKCLDFGEELFYKEKDVSVSALTGGQAEYAYQLEKRAKAPERAPF